MGKLNFKLFIFLLFCISGFSQKTENSLKEKILTEKEVVCVLPIEIKPEFIGGIDSLNVFIKRNINHSKLKLSENGIVYVEFIIDNKGNIKDEKIKRSLSELADKEALRIIKIMPKWNPGYEYGIAVKSKVYLPIKFNK
ncbi:TonB family protein [Flavobacterium marginilacus]|uniref:TonB family protein n=1 Tax=Flavobacterium marginilacus TaxID=3003256 RepID=UPI00248F19D6|nr:TonB family protein [Flavobacterium marginilacus]